MEEVPKEKEGDVNETIHGPVIPLSDVELLRWSSPWLNTFVVDVLGRRVNFHTIEMKVLRD